MTTKQVGIDVITNVPKRKKGVRTKATDNTSYYLDVAIEAIKPMYKNGKTLAVALSSQDYRKLELIKRQTGKNFDLNKFIHKGFELVKDKVDIGAGVDTQLVACHTLQLKPDDESITALLKVGRKNAANHLLRLGMSYYEQRQEL